MKIAVGSDHFGRELRAKLIDLLTRLGQEVVDLGDRDGDDEAEYLEVAASVARHVSHQEVDRGILVCRTGMGMCIIANKVPGVRAAPCYDELTAEVSRRHNDLNVLCLPGEVLNDRAVDRLVEVWLNTPFEGGRHARRIEKIREFERDGNGKL